MVLRPKWLISFSVLPALLGACDTGSPGAPVDGGADDAGPVGTDGDTDSGSDADGECPGYPPGPHGWNLDEPVSLTTFAARYGSDGPAAELAVCDLFADRAAVKSLVVAIGAPS